MRLNCQTSFGQINYSLTNLYFPITQKVAQEAFNFLVKYKKSEEIKTNFKGVHKKSARLHNCKNDFKELEGF